MDHVQNLHLTRFMGRWRGGSKFDITPRFVMLIVEACVVQIFRKEPFFYGHDNYDQLVKIAKVCGVYVECLD